MAKKHVSETTSAPHLAYRTQYDRTGERNMTNRKPFRTAAQKEEARRLARKDSDGAWRSTAPVSYHTRPATNI